MREILPEIRIRMDTAPGKFLDRLAMVAKRSGRFRVDRTRGVDGLPGWAILSLIPRPPQRHRKLVGQVIVRPKERRYAHVELRARVWDPDPPTYSSYVEAVRELFGDLLKGYNRAYRSNRRLSIPSASSLQPRLSPGCRAHFDRLVGLVNKQGMHPLDWEKLYRFVWECRSRSRISEVDMERLLRAEGFNEYVASDIANVFMHLVKFIRYVHRS